MMFEFLYSIQKQKRVFTFLISFFFCEIIDHTIIVLPKTFVFSTCPGILEFCYIVFSPTLSRKTVRPGFMSESTMFCSHVGTISCQSSWGESLQYVSAGPTQADRTWLICCMRIHLACLCIRAVRSAPLVFALWKVR